MPGCHGKQSLPQPGSKRYLAFISAFYTGLAGLEVGDDVRAESSLAESAVLAPGEPAAWADWGILALRQRSYDAASTRFARAHELAPESDLIEYLQGEVESARGNSATAISHFQQAAKLNPRDVRALYQLATEIERQADPGSEQRYEQIMRQILALEPNNLAAMIDLSRVAAKQGDTATLQSTVRALADRGDQWPADVRQQLTELQNAATGPQPRMAATRSIFLGNVLMRLPVYRNDLGDLRLSPGEGEQPLAHFLRVVNPSSRPAPADLALRLTTAPIHGFGKGSWTGAVTLDGKSAPVLAMCDGSQFHLANGATLAFPGEQSHRLTPESILAIDFNYDFKTDLVFAGASGVRLYRQDTPNSFSDVSAATKLPQAILHGKYSGAWAMDIEADGDLDILLGTSTGNPTLLRNNGDGTFATMHPFAGINGLRQATWVDLNGDGNPDAALVDGAGQLHIFLNRRSGSFEEASLPSGLGEVKAITAADLATGDTEDLVAATATGHLLRLATRDSGLHWDTIKLLQVPNPSQTLAGDVRLYAEDFDNNGAVDLLLSSVGNDPSPPQLWLQSPDRSFSPLHQPSLEPMQTFAVTDLQQDGHLDLVGLGRDGTPITERTEGTKHYHWQTIRPRARQATGDQRVNSFGIGGEIEIRSALLVQKQVIRTPSLHFGLGEQTQTDVARILWPNGSVRAEFNLKADQQIVTEQRLKGSCPFLFAWNGHEMRFVKDSVPWGSALGLRINALGTADIAATEEWYKIGREQLVSRDGFYDLRVTGELWESYFYDSLALMTVDHPAGTEVFTDERYDVPAVKLAVTETAEPQPVQSARDDTGKDVSTTVSSLDGVYLDNFGRSQYQGVTRDHFVELTLPQTAPISGPLWLIAKGWLHPSDSSINVALSQNSAEKPHWLSMEVEDADGHWRVAKNNLGFPAGRNKICLFDLSGVFRPGQPRKLRLRTNLEIFWDQIQWAQGLPTSPMHVTRLAPSTADLRYRGFSRIEQANSSSPEIPQYTQLAATAPQWRDLEGFYTRFGDVRELLAKADDRYVIMNAGDELSLHFAVPPPPPQGWQRDFVLAGDGWIKDGDYNSAYSQTVLPYPHHSRTAYNQAPSPLDQDWEYEHHREDWQTYQTRFVTPQAFLGALRSDTR